MMTISEAQSVLHCPNAYGGIYGKKYGQALEVAFRCMEACEETFRCMETLKTENEKPKAHNCNNDYADCDQFVCSKCGIELQDWRRVEHDEDTWEEEFYEYTFNYCPNCGAKIVEPQERSDKG